MFYRDDQLVGFGLKVTPKSKVYIVERRVAGKSKRITIGRHGPWTPDNARREAQKLLAEMAQGVDPNERKHRQRQQSIHLAEVYAEYRLVRHLTPKTVQEYDRALQVYLADWSSRPVKEITTDKVRQRFRQLSEQHGEATANAVMRTLRALLNFAQATFSTEEEPLFRDNPVRILSQTRAWHRIDRRQGYLRRGDLAPWMAAVRELSSPTTRDYLLFLLFTGMRRQEAARLQWSQVDFSNRVLTITDTKNHDPLTLPLSSFLQNLLEERYRLRDPDSPYVFPGNGRTGYIQEPKRALQSVAEKTGISVMLHDLRRTFITMADALEISPYALKRLVNHRQDRGDVTAGYIISDVERLREPMERISKMILEWAEEKGHS
ncbi:MAG: tyrosine-type recombinase/integrase [Acidithiobacillus sp.]|nr:tyrosine-type recombinase/integrase [Acidithiobacillus sp.]